MELLKGIFWGRVRRAVVLYLVVWMWWWPVWALAARRGDGGTGAARAEPRRLGSTALRLNGKIERLAWSRDGRRIAAGGRQPRPATKAAFSVWDSRDGRLLATMGLEARKIYDLSVSQLAFSPDNRTVALCVGGRVRFWELAGGRMDVFANTEHAQRRIAFSEDGKTLASSGNWFQDEAPIALWRAATRRQIRQFGGGAILRFSTKPPRVVSVTMGHKAVRLRTWNSATGELADSVQLAGPRPVDPFALSPDGSVLAGIFCERSVLSRPVFYDGSNGRLSAVGKRNTLGTRGVESMVFDTNGRFVVTGGWNMPLRFWRVKTGEEHLRPKSGCVEVSAMAVAPDGQLLAVGGPSGIVRFWSMRTGDEVDVVPGHTAGITCVSFSPDGKYLATSGGDCAVRIWNVARGTQLKVLRQPFVDMQAARFCPATGALALPLSMWQLQAEFESGFVVLYDIDEEKVLRNLPAADRRPLVFSADGARIASVGVQGRVRITSTATGNTILENSVPDCARQLLPGRPQVSFGSGLAAIGDASTLCVWALQTGQLVYKQRRDKAARGTAAVCFSERGEMLAWGRSGRLTILRAKSGKQVLALAVEKATTQSAEGRRRGSGCPLSAAFSSDGRLVAAGTADGEVHVWDTSTGRRRGTLRDPCGSAVEALAFSPDGSLIASGHRNGNCLLWSVKRGKDAGKSARGVGGK